MSRTAPLDLVVSTELNTKSWASIRLCSNLGHGVQLSSNASFPPWFHGLSALSRQLFRRVMHSADDADSFGFPAVLHRLCTWFSYGISAARRLAFFINFFVRIPVRPSGPGRTEKGRKGGESNFCGNRLRWVSTTTRCRGRGRPCTQSVARGTISGGRQKAEG